MGWRCPAPSGGSGSAEHTVMEGIGPECPQYPPPFTNRVSPLTLCPARAATCDPTFPGEHMPSRSKPSTLGQKGLPEAREPSWLRDGTRPFL